MASAEIAFPAEIGTGTAAALPPSGVDTLHAYEHVRGLYFPIGIAVFALVVVAVAILLIGGSRPREPGPKADAPRFELLYALLLAAIVAVLLVRTFRTETPLDTVAARPQLRVHVTAAQWSWRFEYPGGRTVSAVSTTRPPVAEVPAGAEVEFYGSSEDVIHGFYIPRLRYQRQLLPGYVTRFEMRFEKPGYYGGACSVYCGEQHSEMHFEIRAVSAAEFQRWLSSGEDAGRSAAGGRA
jgi:cytochrome c oxidase subunit 2